MENLLDLTNKTAIVTGASSGMGQAIAKLFAKQGATVIAIARRENRLNEIARENKNIIPCVADVTKEEDIQKTIEKAIEISGKIDILINNAGIMDNMVPVGNLTNELWEKVFAVNTTGVMKFTRAAINEILGKNSLSIVNIASVGGLQGSRAGAAYTASKHATVGLTKNTAFMYAKDNIRCNAICPGGVDTEISKTSGMSQMDEFGTSRVMSGIATNPRNGTAEEIANIALFLASDMSSFINGVTLTADAGWTSY